MKRFFKKPAGDFGCRVRPSPSVTPIRKSAISDKSYGTPRPDGVWGFVSSCIRSLGARLMKVGL